MPLIQQKQIDFSSGGGGLEGIHRGYNQLVHNIAETSYEELLYTGNQLDSVIVWTDSGKTVKIRENLYTYSGGKTLTETIKQYDDSGVLITGEILTGTYTYSGNQLQNIAWVLS